MDVLNKKMKKWILIILMMACIQIVHAENDNIDTYMPREAFGLPVHLTNETGNVIGANCSIQIRNNSMDVINNGFMEEIGGGWYNYTFNTSKVGYYYCRQNCTKGNKFAAGTCDFEVKGDETMPIASILVLIFTIVVWMIMARFFSMEMFSEHGALKMMFMLLVMWMLLLPLSIATQYGIDSGVPAIVTNQMQLFTSILIWINVLVTFYFMLWFIISLVKKFKTARET